MKMAAIIVALVLFATTSVGLAQDSTVTKPSNVEVHMNLQLDAKSTQPATPAPVQKPKVIYRTKEVPVRVVVRDTVTVVKETTQTSVPPSWFWWVIATAIVIAALGLAYGRARDGRDGRDGLPGRDGRDGRDAAATVAAAGSWIILRDPPEGTRVTVEHDRQTPPTA